jgi:hypothetical protein
MVFRRTGLVSQDALLDTSMGEHLELVAIRVEYEDLEVVMIHPRAGRSMTKFSCPCVDVPDVLLRRHTHAHMVEPGELSACRKACRQYDAEMPATRRRDTYANTLRIKPQ